MMRLISLTMPVNQKPKRHVLIASLKIAFRIARQYHRDGDITTEVYIAKILNLYKFEHKKN